MMATLITVWLVFGAAAAVWYADTWREARWFVALGPLTFFAILFARKEQRP